MSDEEAWSVKASGLFCFEVCNQFAALSLRKYDRFIVEQYGPSANTSVLQLAVSRASLIRHCANQ